MNEDLHGEIESLNSSFSGGGATSSARAAGTKIDIAKLVSQNNDLKRLFAEEQRKCKQVDEERRRKDQELRRVEAEMDGFRFRNEQLLKRIEFLQSEMSAFNGKPGQSSHGRTSKKANDNRSQDGVVEEELMKRIQENSDLRNRLENLEALTKEQTDLAAKRMSALESDLLTSEKKHEKATVSLKQERDLLLTRASALEKQLEHVVSDKDSTISMLEAKVASLESQIQQAKGDSAPTNVLLSSELCPPEYCRLNIDSRNGEQAESDSNRQRSRSIASFATNTDALVLALSAYGTAIISLVQHSGIETSKINSLCGQSRSALLNLPQSTCDSTSVNLLASGTEILQSLSSLIREFLSNSDATLQASSQGVCETLDRLTSISSDASKLFSSGEIPSTATEWLRLARLSSSAAGLVHDHYAALVVSFVGRAELKNALDSALQALGAASSSLDTLCSLLDSRARSADANASPLASAATVLRQNFTARTLAFRASCRIPEMPHAVPYNRAIELESALAKAEAERAALAERSERLLKRLKNAEDEREKWMVDAQLRQVRYEKLLQRVTGTLNTDSASSVGVPSSMSMGSLSKIQPPSGSDIGEDTTSSKETNVDVSWLSKHFEDRISLVSSDAQRADSEAASWKAESHALIARLVQAQQLGVRVTKLKRALAERDDELETVKRSYENQLAAMAEHLASMNERIIKQADESEALHRQLRLQHQQAASSRHGKKFLGKSS